MTLCRSLIVLLLVLSVFSCKKDSDGTSPSSSPADFAGTWTGTFSTNLQNEVEMTLKLAQSGPAITGVIYFESTYIGTISATANVNAANWAVDQTSPGCLGQFSGPAVVVNDTLTLTGTGSNCMGTHASAQGRVVRDRMAPSIFSTTPANNDTGVLMLPAVEATFRERLDPSTFTSSTFTLKDAANNPVSGWVFCEGRTASIMLLSSHLSKNTTYTATIAAGVKDLVGNSMASSYVWKFSTTSASSSRRFIRGPLRHDGSK